MKAKGDGLGDLEGEVEKNATAAPAEATNPAASKKEEDDELD